MKNFTQVNRASSGAKKNFTQLESNLSGMAWNLHVIERRFSSADKLSGSRIESSLTLAQQPGNHPVITPKSPLNHPLLARVWRYVALMVMVFGLGVGEMWGDTAYELINQSTGAINTTDFFTGVASASNDKSGKTIHDKSSMNYYITFNSSADPGNYNTNRYIQYDVKTTSTTIYVYFYNGNSSATACEIQEFKEGESSAETKRTKSPSASTGDTIRHILSNTDHSTVYITVDNTKVNVYQVVAVESGTPLTAVGAAGYSLNLNKGRVALASGSDGKIDGIELKTGPSSNYTAFSKVDYQIAKNLESSKYIKFTTPASPGKLKLTYSGGQMAYNTSASDVSATSITSESEYSLSANTPYYLVNTGSATSSITKLEFVGACTAPSSVTVSSPVGTTGWAYIAGETIQLQANVTGGGTGTKTYTWQKLIDANFEDIDGAPNSSTYNIENCAANNSGTYRCKVSTGAGCSTTSAGFDVKVFQVQILLSGATTNYDFTTINREEGYVQGNIYLQENTDYAFKIMEGHVGLGNNAASGLNSGDCTNWGMWSSNANHVGLRTTFTDNYLFTWKFASASNNNTVSVTYPTHNQTADKTIYFDNSKTNWSNIYYRIGNAGHYENSDMVSKNDVTKVAGTANFYQLTTWAYNNFLAWHFADNTSWSGDKNSIYKTDGAGYVINNHTAWQKYVVSSTITLSPTTNDGGTPKVWSVDKTTGMKTYTVTSSATNCTITLEKCTNYGSGTYTALSSGGTVMPTQYVKVTVTPSTGHEWNTFSVSGTEGTDYDVVTAAAAGTPGVYIIKGDVTFTASCSLSTYNINYHDGKGMAFSGSHATGHPTTHTYGTATNLKTATKSGYVFGGWYDNNSFTGDPVTSLGATTYTDDIDLYAKWEKDVYLNLNGKWSTEGKYFAVYCWNNSSSENTWVWMELAEVCSSPAVYKATIPSNYYDRIIFVHKNSNTLVSWENKDHQSADLEFPGSKDQYTLSSADGGEGGKAQGSWASNYSAPTWTISFAGNGSDGGSAMSNVTAIPCDENRTLVANTWTKTGHTFGGWVADVDVKVGGETKTAGTVIANQATIQNIRGNITLTAQWNVKSHTLTWNLAGGTVTTDGTQASEGATGSPSGSVNYGATVTAPVVAKTGYAFSAWTPAVVSPMPDADATYTATWISTEPTISGQPSDVSCNVGDVRSISVTSSISTGGTPTYQWQESDDGSTGWVNVASGGTSASYTVPTASAGTKYYRCVVTNSNGSATTTSSTATVTVTAAAGTTYYLVTSTAQLNTTDTYVIMADDKSAMMGVASGDNAYLNKITSGFTAADDKSTVTVTSTDVNTLTLKSESSAWNLFGKDSHYITTNGDVSSNLYGNETSASGTDDFVFEFGSGKATIKRNVTTDYHIYYSGSGFNQSKTATNIRLYTSNSTPVYTVTYDLNGGEGTLPTHRAEKSSTTITLASSAGLTKSGYTFDGWQCSANSTKYNAGASYTMTAANTTFTAQWVAAAAPTTYTVTFNSNGGSSVSPITQGSAGASITMPTAPTYANHTFQGWVIGGTTYAAGASYTPTANVTAYASWQANCSDGATTTTTFNFNSGSATGLTIASNGSNATYSIVNSTTNTIPVLDGYFLASSFTDNSSGVITITTNDSYTNIDSIKFNSASTDNSNPKIAVYGVKKDGTDSIALLSAVAMSSGTTKTWRATPYRVDIHSRSPKYSGKVRFKLTTGSSGKCAGLDNIVIYNAGGGGGTCYYVTYNGNGAATGFTADETAYGVSSGTTVTVKSNGAGGAAYAKSGYIFSGWNTKSDGTGTSFKAGDTFTISKDTILYAQWADPSSGDCFYIDDAKKKSDYSVSVGGTFDDTKLKGSITGGTVTNTSTESVSFSGNGKYGIIFDASTKKITVRLSSGTLESGATIKIGGYTNNSKSQTCGFKVSGNNCSPASVSTTSGNSSYNFFTQTYTVSAADGVIGTDSFSITLVDAKTYLDSLYVSGCDDCTEGGLSYATASVTKTICDAAFTNTLSNSNSLTGITYSSTNTSVATVDSDGEVTIVGAGTTTIKATAAAQSTYCASEATYSLTVNSGTAAGLLFATASYSKATDDEGFTQTVTNPNSLTDVTYSSSNPSVATVNETTGAVTLVSTGSTTITARTAAQTVSTTCYAAGSASYTISVSGSASCTTLPDYIWKTGSTYTPVGTSHTYADGDYNAIDNSASGTTHISISGSNHEQKSGSLNIGKSKDNYFLITAASGYVIDSIYFYGKMEDGECRMTTDNSSWDVYSAGQTTAKAFAIGVGTQYFGIKNKDTGGDSPKGVWIRTMRIKVCSSSAKYTVTYNLNGHGDAISATTNITPNTTISAPSAPSADCYTFGGWYKEAGCTNAWTFASDKVTNNMTLYAKWTSNKAQVASTDYGKLVYTVTPAGTADALSVTPVDATGVEYKWLEYTSDDVSSASAISGATSSSYSPSIASVGTKYYWAVLVHSCGNDTTDAFRIVVNAAKTDPTIVWGDVQLGGDDATPTYGGGGYTLTGTINAGNALTPMLTTDMISAGEGVVITSKSVNDASKTFSLTFGLTAAFDTTQAKLTDIHFELPGNATYNDSLFATNLDYDKCSSGSASTDVYVVGYTNSTGTSQSSSPANKALKVANTWRSTSSPTFTDKTSADGFSISATTASGTYWAQGTQTFVASTSGATMKTYKLGNKSMTITWTNTSLSFSKVRIIGKNLGSAASTVSVSNGTTSSNFTFENSSDVQVKEVSLDFTYGSEKGVRFTTTNAKELNVLIELVPTGSDGVGTGTTTTLEWKSGYAPSDISGWDGTAKKIVKGQADADFSVVAQQTSATNSLGAITYSSNNEEVATVNSTTGEVDIVAGASGGEATITATMARSGCYKKATLSYIINVRAQACDIKAGSIAATTSATISVSGSTVTKCTSEAVTLTISGHTTDGTTVTWWKDGVQVVDDDNIYNIEGATLATKAKGTYNAKVTGATCAVATNNIKVVDRSASVSVTKLVNQWYIKNGRVTPDIPLFELGEGCSFVGAKADDEDLSDELGGCTVYQKDGSNIVYLQGKAPSGMTVGNVSLQIVVEDVCGNTGTSAAITIHKQVATDKHELAFVVAGTNYAKKTFSEDAWTDGIKASQSTGLALYQVLKDTFKILATNIYASDSIQQIREYYSQFDLICITDYPNTGTKGKNGSSYVDAIGGAMIDVRPLLTMEAYVSGLDNWRAKGVIGSRTTPSERQYNMMLQCKDHEIFDGTTLKQFGYGDDALFRVNIVDSTAHGYVDLDATSKSTHASDTAALQGFTVGEMKDLLPLGTTDNGLGTDLQVGVERQKVMTARMMVLGINSYAMERLSKDGMQIVVNALQYLTKKRSEDISDCSSYFTNADGDNEWGNPLNWRSGTVPTSNQEARITQPVTISDTRKIASIKIATDGTFQDADVDGSITITSTGTLIVTGKVQSVKSPDFMNGFATSAEDVTIEADDDSQGALILNNEDGTTMATVEMYSKAGYEDDGVTPNFAYVGAPVSGMTLGSAFSGAEIWYYDESNPYWWSRCDDSEASNANFLTYCISHWEPQKFTLRGTLAPTGTQNFTLSVHSGGVEGDNMIANSWTAPIDIAQFETSDFDGAEATLYMYRTGHDEVRGTGEEGEGAGKWMSVSVDAAKSYVWPAQLRMIPSMQAFCIEVDGTHTLTMDYDRLVRANAYTYENGEEHAAILAPKRKQAKSGKVDPRDVEGLRLVVSGETTGYDVYLFAHPGFSEAFDNGWDARHMEGGELSNPLLCVPSELGNLDIAAIPELAGRELKFVPSSEREYTFSMTYEGDNELYLNDIKLEESTRIQTGNTYDFVWENGDGHNRFMISAIPFAPQTPTGVTNLDAQTPKAQKFIYKDKMFIIRGGKVFSADGQLVK